MAISSNNCSYCNFLGYCAEEMKFATSNSLLILLARFVEVNNFQAHKIQIVLNNTFYEGMAPKHNSRLTQG